MNNITQEYLSFQNDCRNNQTNNDTEKQSYDNKVNACSNSGFNYGRSDLLHYDPQTVKDDIEQSTAPLMSVLDPNRVKNCNQCLSLNGPRSSHNGWGDSIPIPNPGVTPAQQLVDIDSIMSNRNVKASNSKKGKVNDVDVFKFKTYDCSLCNKDLDPLSSLLTYPKQLYREMSVNRFYDLNLNPQTNIYYDWAQNSQLEASDNYDLPYPYSLDMSVLSKSVEGNPTKCETVCKQNCNTNVLMNNNNLEEDNDNELDQEIYDSDSETEY